MHAHVHRAPRGAALRSIATVLLTGAATWLTLPTPAGAGVLLYDGVPTEGTGKYTAGTDLFGQNPTNVTIIGESGTWSSSDNGTTATLKVNATTLAYPSGIYLSGIGGAVRLSHTDIGGVNMRSLKRAVSPALAGKSFYFSTLMAFDNLSSWANGAYAVCGLTKTRTITGAYPATDGILVGFQKNGTQVDAILRVLGTAYTLQTNVTAGTYFFAGKFVYNASGNDTVLASFSPTSTEPVSWTTNVTAEVLTSVQNLAYVNVGGNYGLNSKYVAFDEWRVGDSYFEVAGSDAVPDEGLPVVTNTVAVATGKTAGVLTGNLATAAPPATVYACWDTLDRGTTSTGAWAKVELVGTYVTPVPLSYGLPGLLANNAYYCRFYATNALGSAWSDAASFTTQVPTVSITDTYAYEGHTGTSPLSLAVTLDAASASNAVVTFATRNSSATGGVDFVASSGQLTILPGVVSTSLTFSVICDTREEFPGNRFWVDLSAPVGATLGNATAEAGILDDDMGKQLLYDDFDDGNDAGWTRHVGAWAVVTKTYRVTGASTNGNSQAGDTAWKDYGLRVMTRVQEAWQSARLRTRAQGTGDPDAGYLFVFQRAEGTQMYSGSLRAGATVLATTPAQYVPNTRIGTTTVLRPVAMRVRTVPEGTRVQCYIGFTQIYDVIDTGGSCPQGRIGLGNGQWTDVYFDNVEVLAEPSPPAAVISIR